MSRQLPYFQFEPAEYLTGDVSFCSLSAQGLFIILCSYYWQRSCKLTKDQFLRRINKENEFNELVDENIIQIENNAIKISFLDEQFESATNKSKTNSINGKKGGRPKKETQNKPEINPTESEQKGIREDKIIKDNTYFESESEFLETWNTARKKLLKVESNIKSLYQNERTDFNAIKDKYTKEEFKDAMRGLFMQKDMFASNTLRPKHFLSDGNIDKYLDAFKNNTQLYKSNKQNDVKL